MLAVNRRDPQHLPDQIPRLQGQGDELPADSDAAITNKGEDSFHFVTERSHLVETEHGARTLDGMQCPEYPVHQVAVARALFQLEKSNFQLCEKLLCFLEECLPEVIDHPITRRTTARSCSGWNGLVIQPVAPAALASLFLMSWDSVVSMITGVNREDGF